MLWQTVKTQMKCHRMHHFVRNCTVYFEKIDLLRKKKCESRKGSDKASCIIISVIYLLLQIAPFGIYCKFNISGVAKKMSKRRLIPLSDGLYCIVRNKKIKFQLHMLIQMPGPHWKSLVDFSCRCTFLEI